MLLALVLALVAHAPTAFAADTAGVNESLGAVCSGLLAESTTSVSGDHAKLCTCLIRQTPAQLSQAEMLAYAQAAQDGKNPPDAVMSKVMAIATACLQQSQ